MEKIGILIPLCSRNQTWKEVRDIDFFNCFQAFFYSSISNKFDYRFYLAIDENDKFLMDNLDGIKMKLHSTKDSVHIMPKRLNKNPYGIWNELLEKAKDECDYFYQVGSDIMHLTKHWDSYFVNQLKKNNNIGFIGGCDKQFWLERGLRHIDQIIENVFFHKTHYEIFGRFIHPNFKTWFGDDFLSQIYREVNSTFICPTILYLNQNRVGDDNKNNRYEPDMSNDKKWKPLAISESKKIKEYIKKNNIALLYND
jgi:hypothetical protein